MADRKNRRNSRKNTRKNTRRNNRNRRNNMMGGAMAALAPMELKDVSMMGPTKESIAQGVDFFGYHSKQHGGAAPVGTTGVLESNLRGYAHLAPLDKAYADIAGLKDQAGGRRRKGRKASSRKGRKTGRKATRKQQGGRKTATRKGRKGRKTTRKQRGGMRELGSMPVDAPGMLLPPSLGRVALSNMNQEWKLAENPTAFAPRV
jgi:hypothetical protein